MNINKYNLWGHNIFSAPLCKYTYMYLILTRTYLFILIHFKKAMIKFYCLIGSREGYNCFSPLFRWVGQNSTNLLSCSFVARSILQNHYRISSTCSTSTFSFSFLYEFVIDEEISESDNKVILTYNKTY